MNQIYMIGDMHGGYDQDKISKKKWPEQKELDKTDVLIALGDFGYIWYHNKHPKYKRDQEYLKYLSEQKFTFCFIDGNHENFDELYKFPEIDMFGSKVREVYHGIYWLQRGHIYNINGKVIFVMGGARSNKNQIDLNYKGKGRFKKLRNQKSYWEQEIPSKDEFQLGIDNLNKIDWKVDIVLTHTCPTEIIKDIFNKTGIINYERLTDPVSLYLDEIEDRLEFKEWYFGHHHQDVKIKTKYGKFYCHYNQKPLISLI